MREGHEERLHSGLVLALSNPLRCSTVIKLDQGIQTFRKFI